MVDPSGPREFATTQWSLVAAAQRDGADESGARAALEALCRAYWFPLYAFVRRSGRAAEDARDLTQAFFTRMIETRGFTSADRERGRFRSYLLGAMKHFLANERQRERAQKRGGGLTLLEWDALDPEGRFAALSRPREEPEIAFDREWALETVAAALRALRDEMSSAGKGGQFDALEGTLTGEEGASRREIAERLGMSEGAVKVAVHRLRRRFRDRLRVGVAETVGSEADLDDEMRHLLDVLRRG